MKVVRGNVRNVTILPLRIWSWRIGVDRSSPLDDALHSEFVCTVYLPLTVFSSASGWSCLLTVCVAAVLFPGSPLDHLPGNMTQTSVEFTDTLVIVILVHT